MHLYPAIQEDKAVGLLESRSLRPAGNLGPTCIKQQQQQRGKKRRKRKENKKLRAPRSTGICTESEAFFIEKMIIGESAQQS